MKCDECDCECDRYWDSADTASDGWACPECGWSWDDQQERKSMPKTTKPTTKPKLPTPLYTEGAEAERRAVRAKLKRELRVCDEGGLAAENLCRVCIEDLLEWLNTRDERTAKRRGGVGRK